MEHYIKRRVLDFIWIECLLKLKFLTANGLLGPPPKSLPSIAPLRSLFYFLPASWCSQPPTSVGISQSAPPTLLSQIVFLPNWFPSSEGPSSRSWKPLLLLHFKSSAPAVPSSLYLCQLQWDQSAGTKWERAALPWRESWFLLFIPPSLHADRVWRCSLLRLKLFTCKLPSILRERLEFRA